MNNHKRPFQPAIIAGMILLVALSRLLPHPPNFTPLGAMALFGAAHFHKKYLAFLVPFLALWISDLFLNNLVYARLFPDTYDGFVWFNSIAVYAGFLLITVLGLLGLRKINAGRLLSVSVSASLIFFLITNFAVWLGNPIYPQNLLGLGSTYLAGIPFFWNTLMGDLFYSALLFGAYAWAAKRVPAFAR